MVNQQYLRAFYLIPPLEITLATDVQQHLVELRYVLHDISNRLPIIMYTIIYFPATLAKSGKLGSVYW